MSYTPDYQTQESSFDVSNLVESLLYPLVGKEEISRLLNDLVKWNTLDLLYLSSPRTLEIINHVALEIVVRREQERTLEGTSDGK